MTTRATSTVRRRALAVVALFAIATFAVGCSDGSSGSGSNGTGSNGSSGSSDGTPADDLPTATEGNYLSLGDSYAQGYQPEGDDGSTPPYTDGFAYLLPELAAAKGYDLTLVNFGCGGATVSSMAETDGCDEPARAPGGPTYTDQSQLEAAIEYLEANPGEVELITVSIGGNDVTRCAVGGGDAVQCVVDALARVDQELGSTLSQLREAAGPDTTIVGLTYPNVILGTYLEESTQSLASLSVTAFREAINPMLERHYTAVDGIFVDVTEGTDGYVPFTETTTLEPYGEIPVAVAEVCELTWFCEQTDIHPNAEGYERIAELIVEALPEA